jgi:hypothetical protein
VGYFLGEAHKTWVAPAPTVPQTMIDSTIKINSTKINKRRGQA